MNQEIDGCEPLAYSLTQAARVSGISRRGLEMHIAARRLRSRKIGGRRVVLRRDLVAFLDHDQPLVAPGQRADNR